MLYLFPDSKSLPARGRERCWAPRSLWYNDGRKWDIRGVNEGGGYSANKKYRGKTSAETVGGLPVWRRFSMSGSTAFRDTQEKSQDADELSFIKSIKVVQGLQAEELSQLLVHIPNREGIDEGLRPIRHVQKEALLKGFDNLSIVTPFTCWDVGDWAIMPYVHTRITTSELGEHEELKEMSDVSASLGSHCVVTTMITDLRQEALDVGMQGVDFIPYFHYNVYFLRPVASVKENVPAVEVTLIDGIGADFQVHSLTLHSFPPPFPPSSYLLIRSLAELGFQRLRSHLRRPSIGSKPAARLRGQKDQRIQVQAVVIRQESDATPQQHAASRALPQVSRFSHYVSARPALP